MKPLPAGEQGAHLDRQRYAELAREIESLRQHEKELLGYIRSKIDQLLGVMGTLPLQPEELEDASLLTLDPIGILGDSFARVLEHLQETNEELAVARDEIQAIFDSAGAGILVVDDRMRLKACNLTSHEIFFPPQADVLGRPCREVVCGAAVPLEECIFERVMTTGKRAEQNDFCCAGRHFYVVGTPIRDSHGQIALVVLVYTDITDRKYAEVALRESEERFRLLYEQAPMPYQSLDDNACFLEVNQAFLDLFGYRRAEVVGRWAGELMDAESRERFRDAFGRFRESGSMQGAEFTMTKKDGTPLAIAINGQVGRDAAGRFRQSHCILHDITERKAADRHIRQLAFYDSVTGLPNRILLQDRLDQALAQAARDGEQVAVLFLDLDLFKSVNDTLGHSIGDLLLRNIAARLRDCVRRADTVARLGGDEFVIVLASVQESDGIPRVARKILDSLALPIQLAGCDLSCTGSIGVAVYPGDGEATEVLLKNADAAMYKAKGQGRNTFQLYAPGMNMEALKRLRQDLLSPAEPQVHRPVPPALSAGRETG